METLRLVVILLHLVGFATLFGAWAVEAFGKRNITRIMSLGMVLALVTGLALAAPWGIAEGAALNHMKIGVKLGVLIVIGALLGIGQAKQRKSDAGIPPSWMFWSIGVLTLANATIAVVWR
jgi:hypothetical protein